MTEKVQTHTFTIHNNNPHQTLIPALERLLPSSVPVLRRIQYDITDPKSTARYIASANLLPGGQAISKDEPWIAAYVDLFAGRETQVWVYSSLEAEIALNGNTCDNDNGDGDDDEKISSFENIPANIQAVAREQFRSLLQFINRELMPVYLSHLSSEETKTESNSSHAQVIPSHQAPAILLGSLHTGLMRLLFSNDSYTNPTVLPGLKVHRYDVTPYVKYIFDPEIFQTNHGHENPLPPGYRYGKEGLLPEHVELVRSRTHIPREPHTLLSMPSVVIYQDSSTANKIEGSAAGNSAPIAWGFLGLDGSLATLHVEPEHRGKGLAVTLSREIMRRGMASGKYGSVDARLASTHADVAMGNRASRRVMEKVGGRGWRWSVTWTVVEVVD